MAREKLIITYTYTNAEGKPAPSTMELPINKWAAFKKKLLQFEPNTEFKIELKGGEDTK